MLLGEEDELVFGDLHDRDELVSLPTSSKIRGAQHQAVKDGLDHIWIDTLCIDKSSSAELGEAINSMHRWYQNAEVCYVYLADLEGCPRLRDEDLRHGGATSSRRYWGAMFRESLWFRRGWTLQELIAPSKLRFYDQGWNLIGDLRDLAATVSDITGIHLSMLQHAKRPEDFSIAQRMCWAAGRETTRPEDRAYSLLGVLDMSIDIRYGEGMKAFTRLQEAIILQSADQSIFAWEKTLVREEDVYLKERRDSYLWSDDEWTHLLAPSPDAFSGAHNIVPCSQASLPYRMTNMGLHITAPVPSGNLDWIVLNCYDKDDPTKAILLNLRCDDAYIQQEHHVIVGHVWLRERSVAEPLSPLSRLSLMDVDQAMRPGKQRELFIAKAWALNGEADPTQRHCNLWLQLQNSNGHCALKFESSEPKPDGHTSSLTWKLEQNSVQGAPYPSILAVSLSLASGKAMKLRLAVLDNMGVLELVDESHNNSGKKTRIANKTWSSWNASLPLESRIEVGPHLIVIASLRREHLNGQMMYIAKVWPVELPIHHRGLKAAWRFLTCAKEENASGEG